MGGRCVIARFTEFDAVPVEETGAVTCRGAGIFLALSCMKDWKPVFQFRSSTGRECHEVFAVQS